MARRFASASSQYLEDLTAVVTALPVTIAAWVRFPAAVSTAASLLTVSTTTTPHQFSLQYSAAGACRVQQTGSVANTSAITTAVAKVGMWTHFCARLISNTSRDAFLDGGGKTSNATNAGATSGLNTTVVGAAHFSNSYSLFANAEIAYPAIWNVALTDDEIYWLSRRVSPCVLRPTALAAYWPLEGPTSGGLELDLNGLRYPLTPTAGPMWVPGPLLVGLRSDVDVRKSTASTVRLLASLGVG